MSFIFICFVFYLIGSLPTAYILVKLKHGKNISEEGSGNIGAMNTYDVTNSKSDGIIVLLIDLLKGFIPVIWFVNYSGYDPEMILIPALFLLAGHNFSIWLKFKGGRGLATGAGILLAVNYSLVLIWLMLYFVLYKLSKNVHIASAVALIILPMTLIVLQGLVFQFTNPALKNSESELTFLFSFCSAVCIIILFKHIEPVLTYLKNKKTINNNIH
ncbi:MAG: glycerol-3-phosphate acyltransferase [Ignavibacteria bacterium]|nr:glycerol-3-phosphate acyltransferase [Ignavibacteria bacterium]